MQSDEAPRWWWRFRVNASNGPADFLNQQSSNGQRPAHVIVDPSGRHVLVANYGGGSVTVSRFKPTVIRRRHSPRPHPGVIRMRMHCAGCSTISPFVWNLAWTRSAYVFNPAAGTLSQTLL